jgi:hypothetical protein
MALRDYQQLWTCKSMQQQFLSTAGFAKRLTVYCRAPCAKAQPCCGHPPARMVIPHTRGHCWNVTVMLQVNSSYARTMLAAASVGDTLLDIRNPNAVTRTVTEASDEQ